MNTAASIPAAGSALSDTAREQYIDDLNHLMCEAMKRFENTRNPKDRTEAVRLKDLHAAAILGRSPEVQARLHAELERRVDEGVNYFAAQGAKDGRALRESVNG